MKKLLNLLLVMFVLYFIVQIGFRMFGQGNQEDYQIKIDEQNVAKIQEVYTNRVKEGIQNYLLTIDVNDQKFTIQTFQGFGFSSRLIKDVKYYQGNYSCIYPIFKKYKQITDVLCLDGGIVKNYQNLAGRDAGLDAFVNKLIEEKLYVNTFKDDLSDEYRINSFTAYRNNIVDGHYLAVNNYHGIYTINSNNPRKIYEVKLFKDDVYQRNLNTLAGYYYMTADYDQEYDFNHIDIVNIKNNNDSVINLTTPISFNSYIQGVVDDIVYLIDKSNKKQYKINVKDRSVSEIGNETTPTKYYDRGTWSELNIYEVVNQEKYFNTDMYTTTMPGYIHADKVGNELFGYFYYYKQNGNSYDVYRANVQEPTGLKYIFTTTDFNNVAYIDDYVYYYSGNYLKVYHDSIGNRTIYRNNEYEFNKSLNYYIYKK